jgi:asparagine synthase (glutamine-hydrolysing)
MFDLAAIFHRDGSPVKNSELMNLLQSSTANVQENMICTFTSLSTGIGTCALPGTDGSLMNQNQGISNQTHQVSIVFDGRVDNRLDLGQSLGIEKRVLENMSDAEIVMHAYLRWRYELFHYVVGDFAVILWDEKRQELLCGTDAFGVKPLVYWSEPQTFVCSSTIRQIIRYPNVVRNFNDDFMIQFLTGDTAQFDITPFKSVHRLSPGCFIRVTKQEVHVKRYWDIDPERVVNYDNIQDYSAHFLQLLRDAVSARLRGNGNIGAHLSGGLDSSSIVSIAKQIVMQGGGNGQLTTISRINNSRTLSDDVMFIDKVRNMWKINNSEHITINNSQQWFMKNVPDIIPQDDTWDEPRPMLPFYQSIVDEQRALQAANITILLTGHAGDHILAWRGIETADLLLKGELRELKRSLVLLSKQTGMNFWELIWIDVLSPILRMKLRVPYLTPTPTRVTPTWLSKRWKSSVPSVPIISNGRAKFELLEDQMQYNDLIAISNDMSRTTYQRYSGVEYRYPFLHRPLVEFMMAIPRAVKGQKDGLSKPLLRQAMSTILPEEVRCRPDKSVFELYVHKGLYQEREKIAQITSNMKLADLGYVDQKLLQQHLDKVFRGVKDTTRLWPLFYTLSLELWLGMELAGGR